MKPFQPMLAATCEHFDQVVFPALCSFKYDGIRCVTTDQFYGLQEGELSTPVSRTLKPIRNQYVQRELSKLIPGLDGELVYYAGGTDMCTFNNTSSQIMSLDGGPNFKFHIIDRIPYWQDPDSALKILMRFERRIALRDELKESLPTCCALVEHRLIENLEQLQAFNAEALERGFEGICGRSPHSPYKFGRSTMKEGWLWKIKPFKDGEGIITGHKELVRNKNKMKEDELVPGAKRHSFADGLIPGGILGAFTVKKLEEPFKGVEFNVGSGLTQLEREDYWRDRDKLMGKVVKFRFQDYGSKDAPRIGTFLGIRDADDMSQLQEGRLL